MAEYPILFTDEMFRAIHAGRKTQTRRVIKPQPDGVWCGYRQSDNGWLPMPTNVAGKPWWELGGINGVPRCPYGVPGDVLWVREAWQRIERGYSPAAVLYRATHKGDPPREGWRPSIHMPRWACRLRLLVKRVWVERVQDISAGDVEREGLDVVSKLPVIVKCELAQGSLDSLASTIAKRMYADLWDDIYARRGYSWESNPWVWCIEFERTD